MQIKKSALCTFGAFVLAVFAASAVSATEAKYPIPCYQGDELAKVREWEKA